jgi:hypothetical protein
VGCRRWVRAEGGWRFRVGGRGTAALEALELGESAVVEALEGGEAPLDAVDPILDMPVGVEEDVLLIKLVAFDLAEVVGLRIPLFGFDAAHAAEEPIGVDEGVDRSALAGAGGAAGVEVLADEGFELGRVLAIDQKGVGIDPGAGRVVGRDGLAGVRAGAGGFLRIAPIRIDLGLGSHSFTRFEQ